jgi:hypothetical protein
VLVEPTMTALSRAGCIDLAGLQAGRPVCASGLLEWHQGRVAACACQQPVGGSMEHSYTSRNAGSGT